MKNILLPIDAYNSSERIRLTASQIAAQLEAQLHVLSADTRINSHSPSETPQRQKVTGQIKGEEAVCFSVDQLLKALRTHDCDLILMINPTGSTTESKQRTYRIIELLERVDCPVMLLPQNYLHHSFSHVMYLVGEASTDQGNTHPLLLNFTQRPDIRPFQLSVTRHPNRSWYRLELFDQNDLLTLDTPEAKREVFHFPFENLIQGLHKFISEKKINLLAIHKSQNQLEDWLFNGDYHFWPAAHTLIPNLILPE